MKVQTLTLKNFTAFADARFEFSPGINVLIGANATGKTHILKLLYATLKTWDVERRHRQEKVNGYETLALRLHDKLNGVFKPDDNRLGRLIHRGSVKRRAEVNVQCAPGEIRYWYSGDAGHLRIESPQLCNVPPSLFVPSKEGLSFFEGFIHAYQNRELSFDETYYDLCVALSGLKLKSQVAQFGPTTVRELRGVLQGKVAMKNGKFFVRQKDGLIEAHLLAEGLRKVAMLLHLIDNGSIVPNSALFWDEPESGLNPRLVKVIADVLLKLAASGSQIFVATHDYLLTNELSLAAEYETPEGKAAKTRFFCLSREKPNAAVEVESGDVLGELENNPILQEFAAHYDREQRLFAGGRASGG